MSSQNKKPIGKKKVKMVNSSAPGRRSKIPTDEVTPVRAFRNAPVSASNATLPHNPADILESQLETLGRDPIQAARQWADECGFGPQKHQLIALLIAGVSAAVNYPVSISLVAEPSGGKSTIAGVAQQILGREFVASASSIQRLSPAALSRMGPKLTRHAVFLDERHRGDHQFESMLRQVASGQRCSRVVVIKGQDVEYEVLPPVSIVDLTLDDHPVSLQDRSRMLRLRMPSTENDRDQISELNLQRFTFAGVKRRSRQTDFAQAMQLFLSGLPRGVRILVPFAEVMQIRATSRLRDRLINNVLNATCTVAWLRLANRERVHDDELGECIIADIEDYRVVYEIVLNCGDDGSDGDLGDNELRLLRQWSEWVKEKGNNGLRRQQFDAVTKGEMSTWQVYRALGALADGGYAIGPRGRGQVGLWQLTEMGLAADHPNLFGLLPNPDEIAERMLNRNPFSQNDLNLIGNVNCRIAMEGANATA